MSKLHYSETEFSSFKKIAKRNAVLLVTATDIETQALHQKLRPLPDQQKILKTHKGDLTYYVGVFGKYKIIHVQCSMGSISRDSSITTVTEALKILKTKIVIMVGIAFGIDPKSQKIGDILIAEAIQPYNFKRVGKKEVIQRSYSLPSSKRLLNRFKNLKTWEYPLEKGEKANLIYTLVLSGEELIDNKKYRDKLLKTYPSARGGEMEGAGVYSACDGKAQCILIKGICDFADGEKENNRINNQSVAIESAISVCIEVFSSLSAFKDLGVLPIEDENKRPSKPRIMTSAKESLFDIYDKTKEKYYVKRAVDSKFNKTLNEFGQWIYGITGSGKSTLILRNLIKNRKKFLHISLASSIGGKIDTFFNEILYEISTYVGETSQTQPKNFTECNKSLLNILEKTFKNKPFLIFIEEIPICDDEEYKEFSEKIYSLLISKSLVVSLDNVRIVLSTISDPTIYIQSYHQKVTQQIKFVEITNWNTKDITKLVSIIEKESSLKLDTKLKTQLITSSKGSPRFIKKFFRNLLTINKIDSKNMCTILKETERELNLI